MMSITHEFILILKGFTGNVIHVNKRLARVNAFHSLFMKARQVKAALFQYPYRERLWKTWFLKYFERQRQKPNIAAHIYTHVFSWFNLWACLNSVAQQNSGISWGLSKMIIHGQLQLERHKTVAKMKNKTKLRNGSLLGIKEDIIKWSLLACC